MDREVVRALKEAGVDVTWKRHIARVGIHVDPETDEVLPLDEEEVPVVSGDAAIVVPLKRIGELFAGDRAPPDLSRDPPDEYVPFFATIETTVADYCSAVRIHTDDDFEEAYRWVRRRPDEASPKPLVGYIQAAVRLYMSLRDVSRAEFEAVLGRLARSARTFRMGPSSVNYYDNWLTRLLGRPGPIRLSI